MNQEMKQKPRTVGTFIDNMQNVNFIRAECMYKNAQFCVLYLKFLKTSSSSENIIIIIIICCFKTMWHHN